MHSASINTDQYRQEGAVRQTQLTYFSEPTWTTTLRSTTALGMTDDSKQAAETVILPGKQEGKPISRGLHPELAREDAAKSAAKRNLGGRPVGSQNRYTGALKELFLQALHLSDSAADRGRFHLTRLDAVVRTRAVDDDVVCGSPRHGVVTNANIGATAWMVDQFSLGPGAEQKYRRPARSSVSSNQQLCLLHLWYRTGRQISSLCRSTLWLGSGRRNSDHSKSSRLSSNGLWRGHGGRRDKRPLCPSNSILAPRQRPLSCSSHPPKCEQPSPRSI
jgi:hypothetical protein